MGSQWRDDQASHCVSAPIDLEGRPARVAVNVDGVGPRGQVRVEILDEQLRTLPGYERDACADFEPGLRQPARWGGVDAIEPRDGRVRLRVHIEGVRPEDVRLYAVYVETAPSGLVRGS